MANKGNLAFKEKRFEDALGLYFATLDATAVYDSDLRSKILANISLTFYHLTNFEESLNYINQALHISKVSRFRNRCRKFNILIKLNRIQEAEQLLESTENSDLTMKQKEDLQKLKKKLNPISKKIKNLDLYETDKVRKENPNLKFFKELKALLQKQLDQQSRPASTKSGFAKLLNQDTYKTQFPGLITPFSELIENDIFLNFHLSICQKISERAEEGFRNIKASGEKDGDFMTPEDEIYVRNNCILESFASALKYYFDNFLKSPSSKYETHENLLDDQDLTKMLADEVQNLSGFYLISNLPKDLIVLDELITQISKKFPKHQLKPVLLICNGQHLSTLAFTSYKLITIYQITPSLNSTDKLLVFKESAHFNCSQSEPVKFVVLFYDD